MTVQFSSGRPLNAADLKKRLGGLQQERQSPLTKATTAVQEYWKPGSTSTAEVTLTPQKATKGNSLTSIPFVKTIMNYWKPGSAE